MHKASPTSRPSFWQAASVIEIDPGLFRRGINKINVYGAPGYYDLTMKVVDPLTPPLYVDLAPIAVGHFGRTIQLSARVAEASLSMRPPTMDYPPTVQVDGRAWTATSRVALDGIRRYAGRPSLLIAKARQVLGARSNVAFLTQDRSLGAFDYGAWQKVFESPSEFDRLLVALTAQVGDRRPLQLTLVGALSSSMLDVPATPPRSSKGHRISHSILESDVAIVCDRGAAISNQTLDAVAAGFAFASHAIALYGDHDTVEPSGARTDPVFKPDWSPTYQMATGYAGPLVAVRLTPELTEVVTAVAGRDDPATAILDHLAAQHPTPYVAHVPAILSHLARPPHPRAAFKVSVPATGTKSTAAQRSVTAIIPTKNNPDQLVRACRSVLSATGVDADVVLVDNGAGSPLQQAALDDLSGLDRVSVEPHYRPFNFSAMINAGRRRARGDILLLLNDDVESLDETWLATLADIASRPDIGAVGAMLLYPDGRIQHAGVFLRPQGPTHAFQFHTPNDPDLGLRLSAVHEVAAVTAACLAVRTDAFDAVGGFAEDLRVTLNDIDFCLKMLASGRRNLMVPAARLIHHESVSRGLDSTPSQIGRLNEDTMRFMNRWQWMMSADPYFSPHMSPSHGDYRPRDVDGFAVRG